MSYSEDWRGKDSKALEKPSALASLREKCLCWALPSMEVLQVPAGPDILWSLAGPLKAGQPTMKFVMDTSKFWFKPSISRDRGEAGKALQV